MDSNAIHFGRNRDLGPYKDDHYVRCDHCGWILNTDRHPSSPEGSKAGDGIVQVDQITGTRTIKDPVVASGCPQCGCLIYRR